MKAHQRLAMGCALFMALLVLFTFVIPLGWHVHVENRISSDLQRQGYDVILLELRALMKQNEALMTTLECKDPVRLEQDCWPPAIRALNPYSVYLFNDHILVKLSVIPRELLSAFPEGIPQWGHTKLIDGLWISPTHEKPQAGTS